MIAFWGDSLTAGTGSGGHGIDSVVARALRVDTVNCGIGGQTSRQIAARLGGAPARLTVERNRIPATGVVAATAIDVRLLSTRAGPEPRWLTGSLAGVAGALEKDQHDRYLFSRSRPGAEVICPPSTPFRPDRGVAARAGIHVLWLGRNNFDRADQVLRDVAACVALVRSLDARFLVLGVPTGDGETRESQAHADVTSLNDALAATYRSKYLDVRRHLIDHGLAAARVAPTAQDALDLAGDTVPSSLRSDPTHLHARGYRIVGHLVADEIARRRWTGPS